MRSREFTAKLRRKADEQTARTVVFKYDSGTLVACSIRIRLDEPGSIGVHAIGAHILRSSMQFDIR
ncbi:hypothetical protein WS84_19840 [Burkholderia anthina]|nr:hypothetical protein WS84_19840 [Burkholderia anthina]